MLPQKAGKIVIPFRPLTRRQVELAVCAQWSEVHSLIPMQKREYKKLLALADLLFTAKISDAAKRAGIQAEFV